MTELPTGIIGPLRTLQITGRLRGVVGRDRQIDNDRGIFRAQQAVTIQPQRLFAITLGLTSRGGALQKRVSDPSGIVGV